MREGLEEHLWVSVLELFQECSSAELEEHPFKSERIVRAANADYLRNDLSEPFTRLVEWPRRVE